VIATTPERDRGGGVRDGGALVRVPARRLCRLEQRALGFHEPRDRRCGQGRFEGIVPHRRLPGQHDRVGAVEHGVGDVGRLGARWPRRVDHRLQHLGGDDRGPSRRASRAHELFLDQRDLFHRQFHAEVSARDHHGVGLHQDPLDVGDGRPGFDLRDDRDVSVAHSRAELAHVARRPDERLRHEIGAELERARQPLAIAIGDRRQAETLGRNVHALAAANGSACEALCLDHVADDRAHGQLDRPVGEQDAVALPEVGRQARVRGARAALVRLALGSQLEPLSRPERERIGAHG
jgi:hypothetical protein